MQDAFVHRLHAEHQIATYRPLLEGWFGERVEHVCSMRAALTLVARELHEQGIDPGDKDAARPVLDAVARRTRGTRWKNG